jgi:hypothetical protein
MFCQKCGAQIDPGTNFCRSCGAPVSGQQTGTGTYQQPEQTQYQYQQPQYGQTASQQPKKKKKGCLISIIAVAALVIILIVAAVLNGGELSFSTANVSEAYMASAVDPNTYEPLVKTDVFAQSTTTEIYATVLLRNVPSDTEVSAIWYHITSGSSVPSANNIIADSDMWIDFSLSSPGGFAAGDYKVDILLDGEVEQTLYFTVQ